MSELVNESIKTLMHMAETAYYRESKYAKALEFLDEAITIDPQTVEAYSLKGRCEIQLLQYPKAVNSLNMALKYDPDNVESLLNLAYINIQVGDYEQAKAFIARVLAKKAVSEAYELLADLAHLKKTYKEAIEHYNRAIQLAPSRDSLYYKKALCHSELRQFKDAIRNAELAHELNNQNLDAKKLADDMSNAYFSKGRGFWAGILLKLQMPYLKEKLKEEMLLQDEIKRIQKASDELSWDPAFKIRTKTYFDSKYSSLVDEAKNTNQPISVLLFDVDNMKIFNEVYGHRILNQILGYSGDLMNESITDKDLAARWGGDELIMVLPNTDREGAKAVYSTFRSRLNALNETTLKEMGIKHKFSFSVGLASASVDMEDNGQAWGDQLFDKSDLAVKMAKLNGKDQLIIFDLGKKVEWETKRDNAAAEDKKKAAKGERPV